MELRCGLIVQAYYATGSGGIWRRGLSSDQVAICNDSEILKTKSCGDRRNSHRLRSIQQRVKYQSCRFQRFWERCEVIESSNFITESNVGDEM